ncbi:stage II sporulation protein D [Pseudogracilibacillus auburnensis]|uniref:stage II sporulation protein D n=1 Tax=Pseudogracilibacillus auburnensis TaxID=1494959 RepID=UPI001A956EAB|nr:stage II sporulation protein D [Pseudogracilibacillus auburnensis]MBO1004781.1 stage II sporulation protein D [Pseudogracilibacillus auburnensis]
MKQFKPIFYLIGIMILLSFTIPAMLALPTKGEKTSRTPHDEEVLTTAEVETVDATVAVFRRTANAIEELPLEDYIIGVVASEMPASFEMEALKAQALAARTYTLIHLLGESPENLPEGADVDDTVNYQVYKNKEELKEQWGKDFTWKYQKIKKAVKETNGEIITYEEKPITATFFSTSNGYTENAEEYWKNQIPYLKSVESPWDKQSPEFVSEKKLKIADVEKMLGVKIANSKEIGTIISRTAGNKVATVEIGGKTFTGRDIREKLVLRSTDFSWKRNGDSVIFTTKGYGHGIGMSQYGANGMALEGKSYLDIVHHYYQDIAIGNVNQFYDRKLAMK